MKKRTKKYIFVSILLIISILILSLPRIVNTQKTISIQGDSNGILTKLDSTYSKSRCEENKCPSPICIDAKDLPPQMRDIQFCLCCIAFDYQKKGDGTQIWTLRDYKLKISYMDKNSIIEKPFYISDKSTKISVPTKNGWYITLNEEYIQPYYFKGDYPDSILISLNHIKINYRAMIETIVSALS